VERRAEFLVPLRCGPGPNPLSRRLCPNREQTSGLIMKDGSIRHVFPLKGVSWEFWSFQRWLPRDRKSRLGSLGYILSKDLPTKLAGRFNKNAAPRD
jgi:hypothetical protein